MIAPLPRLPLRATPWRQLNREFWSHGKAVNADRLERRRARALASDIPVERMSLEQLIRTQSSEPLTESRRAYLHGLGGALSLERLAANHDARRYGTPYTSVDPITAKQIAWEQRAWHTGPCITARRQPDGRIALDRWVDGPTFHHIRESMATYGIGAGPRPRARLTSDALREARRRTWQWTAAEIARQQAPADPIWHSAHEVTHAGKVVATVTAPRRRDTWHHRALDEGELELGTDLIADEELESLLGITPDE